MTYYTKEEYLKLVSRLMEDHDSDDPEDKDPWIPAISNIKDKMINARANSNSIDLSNASKQEIMVGVKIYNNIKIEKFSIKMHSHMDADKRTFDIWIYEESDKSLNGAPGKMIYKINLGKDDRFSDRPWLNYFYNNTITSRGIAVPEEVVCDIVRWLQAINRMKAFL